MRSLELCLCIGALLFSASALPSESVCVDGSSYKQDCNDCICQDGVISCTQRACAPEWYQNRPGSIPEGAQCAPGSRWMDECNWCSCSENGLSMCTLMGCVPGFQPDPNQPTCEDGSTWKIDECNRCKCVNGKQACSKRQCSSSVGSPAESPSHQNPDHECEGEGRWRKDCNWCRCNDGKGLCTRRGCPAALIEQLADKPDCEGQISFKQDCNTCNCVNGRSACTTRFCGPVQSPSHVDVSVRSGVALRPTDLEPTCTAGSSWREECNWCFCTERGVGECTLKGCLPGSAEQLKDEPECDGTSRWKKDCNWCTCKNGRGVCSRRACLPGPVQSPSHVDVSVRSGVALGPTILEPTCTDGSRWRVECNWCSCTGGVGVCTLKGCLPGSAEQLKDEPECDGTSRWKKDCNWCTCKNGRGVCSRRACLPAQVQSPSISRSGVGFAPTPPESTCTTGSRWRQDCNWCTCSERGIGMCTLRGCPPESSESLEDEPECEGNSRWKKDCNWCNCVDGKGVCTKRACAPVRPQSPAHVGASVGRQGIQFGVPEFEPTCTNGSRWRVDCNWCTCTETGIAACTERACILEVPRDEPDCEGKSRWKKDCNWCNCVEGHGVCTKKACIPDLPPHQDLPPLPPAEAQCTAGSRWRVDCNWCHCTEAGIGLCTKVGCPAGYVPSPDEAQCTDGSRWKIDCNWCNCANEKQLCTQIACGINRDFGQSCIEGETWMDDCNRCECNGGRGLCTKRACAFGTSPAIAGPECREGDSWVEDCNQCRCANGLKLCTRKLCGNPSLPEHCRLPPVNTAGPLCAAFQRRWTFDSDINRCKQIVYGGCRATQNLFASESECQASCNIQPLQPIFRQVVDPNQERCLLTQDPGPCFAYIPKYFYNKETGSCQEFIYGGCAGNFNRFHTIEECQATCGGIVPVTGKDCDRSQCPWMQWGHYIAKGCLPQYEDGSCCPTSFSCSSNAGIPPRKDKCFYKNKEYNIGDRFKVDHKCTGNCFCLGSSVSPESAKMRCASIECPHNFRPKQPGCRPLYKSSECCPYDFECVDPQSNAEIRSDSVCVWEEKTYREGDKLFFKDQPCQECICSGNFSGPFGSGCSKIDCGLSFRYTYRYEQGCVPIYFENKCCPIDWLCPDDSRIVEYKSSEREDESSEREDESSEREDEDPEDRRPDQCHLGSKSFEVGESVELNNCLINCQCTTPPELTCIQYQTCEKATNIREMHTECPEVTCGAECSPIVNAQTGCLSCSCQNRSFTCPEPNCQPLCETTVSYETGCPGCKCECPLDPSGRPHCPMDCPVRTVIDDSTGCPKCECDPNNPVNPFEQVPPLPPKNDNCPKDPSGQAPCPLDCAIQRFIDENTGCEVCMCDPSVSVNPFAAPVPPVPGNQCRTGPDGRAPCPMDCAIQRFVDEKGCEVCRCDPNNPGNPFVPPQVPRSNNCRVGPDGRAPCPMDCAIERFVDKRGCEVCRCDPNNPGNPFGPPKLPPRSNNNCRLGPDGRAPCPMDCAIERFVDKRGCEVCRCDPNNPGNPFDPPKLPPRSNNNCRVGPDGRAPCPMDCAIERFFDKRGCEVCRCDPNNPGNPFGPPPVPPRPSNN